MEPIVMVATMYFITGFFVGCMSIIGFLAWQGRKVLNKRKEAVKRLNDELDKILKSVAPGLESTASDDSVRDRLKRVKDITDDQLDMQSTVEGPQKNGLDGRYKNGLNREIKRMEEEKKEILSSILKDGFDPTVSVITGSGVETMPLSEFMAQMGMVDAKVASSKPEEKVVKLTIHKGGKEDNKPIH